MLGLYDAKTDSAPAPSASKRRKARSAASFDDVLQSAPSRTPGFTLDDNSHMTRTMDIPGWAWASLKGAFRKGFLRFDVILGHNCAHGVLVGIQSRDNPKIRMSIDLTDGLAQDHTNRVSPCLVIPDGGFASGTRINFRLELSEKRNRLEIGVDGTWNEYPVFRVPGDQGYHPTIGMCVKGQSAQFEILAQE